MAIEPYVQVIELLPEATLLVSGAGIVRAANRGVAARLGLDPRGLAGRRLADLVADPSEEVAGYLRACARSRSMVLGSLRLLQGEGPPLDCRAEGAVLRPRSGEDEALLLLRLVPKLGAASQFVALNQKIDELSSEIQRRRRAEEELREQREWLRVTLTSIGDAVIATDTAGRVTFLNPVAEVLTAWPSEEAIGRPLGEVFPILHETTRRTIADPVARVLAEGIVVGLGNHTVLIARDGTERPIDDAAAPIRDEAGRVKGVVLIFHDVSERRALERELTQRAELLAEADRRKNEFLAMLAHELRNPLAPILNALRLLRTPGADAADLAWAAEVMERQVRHMARLVDDLLDVSRINRGVIELRKERVELAPIVTHAIEVSRPLIEARHHALTVALPSDPIVLEADPARLEQALANLLNNAAKYTEPGGRIWLEVEPREGGVEIRVRDTGVGIAPELLPAIFDLFVQADRSLARSQGGLGIGLTLVRSLVEGHGGSVSARSAGPGQGSEFIVRLPVVSGGRIEPVRPAPAPPGPEAAGPHRVLVVDDNVDSARSLARLLRRWGHDVQLAYDGPGAIQAAHAFRPDVILLDIGLPALDGYAVARQLRADPNLCGTLLVAVTGYGQDIDREQSRLAGFDRHLVKPVDADALRDVLLAARR